jgi:hypothetical protein
VTDGIFLTAPYNRFKEFISPGAGRFALLRSVLWENGLRPHEIPLAGKRHLALSVSAPYPLVLTAHYDRARNSPGANDNSAAVFMLIQAAMELGRLPARQSAFFVFTDKEELTGGEGINDQGSYSLALFLKEQGRASRVFCLDACGAGDTLVISTAADQLLKNQYSAGAASARNRVRKLRAMALEAARDEKALLLPTPFSDDAGFLKAGVAAQTITVLPSAEAAAFASLSRTKSAAAAALITPSAALSAVERNLIPETWQSLNGPGDSFFRLTPRYWKHVVQFVKTLVYSS